MSREIPLLELEVGATHDRPVHVRGGEEIEELYDDGRLVGRLVRTRWAVNGRVTVTSRDGQDDRVSVLQLAVANDTAWAAGPVAGWTDRDVAARYSFVGTHLLVTVDQSRFVPLLTCPDWADADATSCRQERCWPALIGDDAGVDGVLVSPIILGDHPTIAPESAGDLFDATEIDEILTLRIMTMTDDEKADARGTDPRAAAILARLRRHVRSLNGALPDGVKVVDYGIRGMHLAYDLLDGYDALVVVDALPGKAAAGDLSVLEVGPDDLGDADFDAHGMAPVAALGSLGQLGGALPRTFVVGCQPADVGRAWDSRRLWRPPSIEPSPSSTSCSPTSSGSPRSASLPPRHAIERT